MPHRALQPVAAALKVARDGLRPDLGRLRGGAAWLVLPCCLQVAPYVDARVKLPDDVRFALLCGAMAHRHDAQRVDCIDRRISARAIVLVGGLE